MDHFNMIIQNETFKACFELQGPDVDVKEVILALKVVTHTK